MAWTFAAVVLLPIVGNGEEIPVDLEDWIATAPPEIDSERGVAAEQDIEHEWVVLLRDGRPRVALRNQAIEVFGGLPFRIEPGSSRDGLAGRRFRVEVADGWVVAFNGGEFGAGLWWFSADGTDRYRIAEAWVEGFIRTAPGLFALEGLAHGDVNRGRLLRIAREPGSRWSAEEIVDLGQLPQAATLDTDGTLLVVTFDRLLRVDPSRAEIEILLDQAFWHWLDPNSIVVAPSGTICLGMRHGVARVEMTAEGRRVRWLLPNRTFDEMKPIVGFKEE
ncbi:SMP-30/gluconolactonase/LRE family protein [Tautonia plasticadhaerens]|nr:hypothetical protein [Tautonia plasticadhaerens]